jgi:branched-chain amino acid transport system substrate-binding protein
MSKTTGGIGRRTFIGGTIASAGVAITGFPHVARAQAKTIKVGMPTILSGRVALLGTSSRTAVQVAFNQINEAGGINGRKLELVDRDSKGRPDEAAKVTRDLINNDGCEIIIDGEASSGSFAVHEVIRDLGVLCLHTCSESSTLTADPKQLVKTAFRCARLLRSQDRQGKGPEALGHLLARLRLWPRQHGRVHRIRQAFRTFDRGGGSALAEAVCAGLH